MITAKDKLAFVLVFVFALISLGFASACHCGDNSVNQFSEQCDDGNIVNGDGCSADCQTEFCGDNECNNYESCSTCSSDCGVCEPECGDGTCNGDETCSTCSCDCGTCPPPQPYCGDEVCNNGETCSTCSSDCGTCPPPTPYCGDEVCNNGETCSTCSCDCGICPTLPCDLIHAHWSVSSAFSGDVVSLITHGTNCNGKTINFEVFQDEPTGDEYITNTATAVFSGSDHVTSNWVAVAPSNGDTTPTYYFIAYVLGSSESIQSDNLDAIVRESCGDTICNNGETCSTCSTDCGICPPEPHCGDTICNNYETCTSCSADCGLCPVTDKYGKANHFVQFCSVDWKCSGWSECVNGMMTRDCLDKNNCDIEYNKPYETSDCNGKVLSNAYVPGNVNSLWIILVIVLFVLLLVVILYLIR